MEPIKIKIQHNRTQKGRHRRLIFNKLSFYLIYVALSSLLTGVATANTGPWIMVDTHARTLSVYDNGKVISEFRNIAIGRGGASRERHKGDDKTPLGTFHIMWINTKSRYDIFLGLDYPTIEHATRALQENNIKNNEFRSIKTAFEHNTIPPQDTSLGGYIGIHGLGDGNIKIHRMLNWTKGCIALTNEQIERLARIVQLGTKVVIR